MTVSTDTQNTNSERWGFSRQAAWLFGSQVLMAACAVIYSAMTARVLGPSSKGILTLAITIPGYVVFALSLGLDVSCTFFISSGRKPAAKVAGTALVYSIAAGAVILGTAACLSPWMHSHLFHGAIDVLTLLTAFTAVPVGLATIVLTSVLLGMQKIRELSIARVIGSLFMAVLIITLWTTKQLTVFWSVAAAISATTITGLLAYRSLRAAGMKMELLPDVQLFSQEVKHGIVAYSGNLAQWLNYRMDVVLIGFMLRPIDVGLYAAAVSLAEVVWHLPNTLAQLIFPKVAKLPSDQARRLTLSVCKWTILFIGLALAVMGLFGLDIIRFVLGNEYAPAVTALRLLLPGTLALSISKILTGDLNGRGKPKYGAYSSWAALPVTLIGNVILIPRLGIAGAAITSSLSYITGAIVVSVLYFMECRTSDRKLNQQLESKAKDNIFPAIAPDSRRTAAYAEEVR